MHTFTKLREYWSQIRAAGNDDANVNRSQIEEQPKVIEVSVIDRVFTIPLDLQSYMPLETINFVRRAVKSCFIDDNRSFKFLFDPLALIKCAVKTPRNRPAVASRSADFRFVKPESSKDLNDVVPLVGTGGCQNAGGIAPFLYVIELLQVLRNKVECRHMASGELCCGYDAGLFVRDLRFQDRLCASHVDS